MKRLPLILALLLPAAHIASAADQPIKVTVHAGEFDRRGTVVSVVLPRPEAVYSARFGSNLVPVSVDFGEDGMSHRVWWMVEELKKGQTATYELSTARSQNFSSIHTSTDVNRVQFKAMLPTRTLMEYRRLAGELPRENIKAAFKRGGYLHPILTLSGRQVTDDYPSNHIHHHGVWWAWTHTKFQGRAPDFWNMGDNKGRVDSVDVDQASGGPVFALLRARHRQVDLLATPPVTVLNENWEVRAYVPPYGESKEKYWFFDLIISDRCATDDALELPEYRYGGIGLRGNWAWNGKDKVNFLTSDGETDRIKGNATRGRWCDMWGEVDGAKAGIAILGHPSNFRAPQPMRLHPSEPFFNFAPQQAGDMSIKPGETFTARYRFVVHDGPPDRAELDRLWNDYANPPEVQVVSEKQGK